MSNLPIASVLGHSEHVADELGYLINFVLVLQNSIELLAHQGDYDRLLAANVTILWMIEQSLETIKTHAEQANWQIPPAAPQVTNE